MQIKKPKSPIASEPQGMGAPKSIAAPQLEDHEQLRKQWRAETASYCGCGQSMSFQEWLLERDRERQRGGQ